MNDQPLLVIGIIDGETVTITKTVSIPTQNTKTDRMEGSCPNRLSCILVTKGGKKPVLYLLCRLVCECDGKNSPRRTGAMNELREDLLDLPGIKLCCHFESSDSVLVNTLGYFIGKICITVFNKVSDSVNKHRCLAASRAGKDQKRPFCSKNSATLLGI